MNKKDHPKYQVKTRISEYTPREELLNVMTHGVGLILSIIGIIFLFMHASNSGTDMHMIGYIIFGSTLIALYLASTMYHLFSNTELNQILKKIDHLSIYFLIAGTYSPLMLVGIKGTLGLVMLGIIWILAFVNCILRISNNKILQNIAFASYLIMGWLVLIVIDELMQNISWESFQFLVIGGILYTSGIIFYLWEKLPFNHSIWHLFVLGGSASHFFSIYYLIPLV